MKNSEKYQERIAQLPSNNLRPGDVVVIHGKHRLVTDVRGGLISTGKGRGYRRHWTLNNIEALVGRNFTLKAGMVFDGVR